MDLALEVLCRHYRLDFRSNVVRGGFGLSAGRCFFILVAHWASGVDAWLKRLEISRTRVILMNAASDSNTAGGVMSQGHDRDHRIHSARSWKPARIRDEQSADAKHLSSVITNGGARVPSHATRSHLVRAEESEMILTGT